MIKLTTINSKDKNKIIQTAFNWTDTNLYGTNKYSKFIYKFCRWYIRSMIDELILKENTLLVDLIVTDNSIDLGLYIMDYYKILANVHNQVFPITVVFPDNDNSYFTYYSNCNIFKHRREYLNPSLKLLSRKEKELFSILYNLEDFNNVNNSTDTITDKI